MEQRTSAFSNTRPVISSGDAFILADFRNVTLLGGHTPYLNAFKDALREYLLANSAEQEKFLVDRYLPAYTSDCVRKVIERNFDEQIKLIESVINASIECVIFTNATDVSVSSNGLVITTVSWW